MSYETLEKNYKNLTEEQQHIVYNLILSLSETNVQGAQCCPKKRQFGKYARCATAIFAEDWQITEEEFLDDI